MVLKPTPAMLEQWDAARERGMLPAAPFNAQKQLRQATDRILELQAERDKALGKLKRAEASQKVLESKILDGRNEGSAKDAEIRKLKENLGEDTSGPSGSHSEAGDEPFTRSEARSLHNLLEDYEVRSQQYQQIVQTLERKVEDVTHDAQQFPKSGSLSSETPVLTEQLKLRERIIELSKALLHEQREVSRLSQDVMTREEELEEAWKDRQELNEEHDARKEELLNLIAANQMLNEDISRLNDQLVIPMNADGSSDGGGTDLEDFQEEIKEAHTQLTVAATKSEKLERANVLLKEQLLEKPVLEARISELQEELGRSMDENYENDRIIDGLRSEIQLRDEELRRLRNQSEESSIRYASPDIGAMSSLARTPKPLGADLSDDSSEPTSGRSEDYYEYSLSSDQDMDEGDDRLLRPWELPPPRPEHAPTRDLPTVFAPQPSPLRASHTSPLPPSGRSTRARPRAPSPVPSASEEEEEEEEEVYSPGGTKRKRAPGFRMRAETRENKSRDIALWGNNTILAPHEPLSPLGILVEKEKGKKTFQVVLPKGTPGQGGKAVKAKATKKAVPPKKKAATKVKPAKAKVIKTPAKVKVRKSPAKGKGKE